MSRKRKINEGRKVKMGNNGKGWKEEEVEKRRKVR